MSDQANIDDEVKAGFISHWHYLICHGKIINVIFKLNLDDIVGLSVR